MSLSKRALPVAASALLLAAMTFTAVHSADAASAPASLPVGEFTLTSNYHQFDAVNATLVSMLGTVPVHTIMDGANHNRSAISAPAGVIGYAGGFGFDSGDNNDCTNYPQGITSSRDAVGTADNGSYDGRQLMLASWYTTDGCTGATTRSRITLVDWDSAHPDRYQKILLVEPTGTATTPSFKDITVHAGGVSWYGDYLYVADTGHGMRVFDMQKILRTDTGGTSSQIGRQSDGTYYAHNYSYVLPQVGTITADTTSGTPLVWSTISLDRVSGSIVMAEYTCQSGCTSYPNRAPRAIRFPFASGATTFAATTTASQALQLPWYKLNGVASHNGRWWFNSSGAKQLYYWTPSAGSRTYAWVSGGESISYWEDATSADLLWSLQETRGHRSVFSVSQSSYGS
jgi:hypothetical protein